MRTRISGPGFHTPAGKTAGESVMVLAFLALILLTSWGQPIHAEENPRDLTRFLEMDDPLEAARQLREHAERHGLSSEHEERGKPIQWRAPLIHVFSGYEFRPPEGIEEALLLQVERLMADSLGEHKVVCIVQFRPWMTIDDVIEVLETGTRSYDRVGRNAYIARMPASSVTILGSAEYVRWIGEYKPEYKYDPDALPGRRIEAHIYPLGGGRDAYRTDLADQGIVIKDYSGAEVYSVDLDADRFGEVAEKFWWVRGIQRCPEVVYW